MTCQNHERSVDKLKVLKTENSSISRISHNTERTHVILNVPGVPCNSNPPTTIRRLRSALTNSFPGRSLAATAAVCNRGRLHVKWDIPYMREENTHNTV
jgi:hypothetical protein